MKLAYKHQVTVVSIPAGINVGKVTSREGAYLVTASTDPEIKAPSIIQANSELLKRFNVEHEYTNFYQYPWYRPWQVYSNALGGAGGAAVAEQQQGNQQNYSGTLQGVSNVAQNAITLQMGSQRVNTSTNNNDTNWTITNTNATIEEIQNEVDKLISSGAV